MKRKGGKIIAVLAGVLAAVVAGFVVLYGPTTIAGLAEDPPYIDYRLEQGIRSAQDDRAIETRIGVGRFGISYDYSEGVHGALTPTVRTRSFYNRRDGWFWWLSADRLSKDLLKAGVCDLRSDPNGNKSPYGGWLHIGIGETECQLDLSTIPDDARRAEVHRILTAFAHDTGIDQPGKDVTVKTSEGDAVAPRGVTLSELLANPDAYDGKRVSVIGTLTLEFEGDELCAPARTGERPCIWFGAPSSFAMAEDVRAGGATWVRIEGVFVKGPAGHMDLWPGEIDRITKIDPLMTPTD